MALLSSIIVADLVALKAIPGAELVQGLPVVVTDYDEQKLPAMYVYYPGTTDISDGEPIIVFSTDNLGYFMLLAASPISPNT